MSDREPASNNLTRTSRSGDVSVNVRWRSDADLDEAVDYAEWALDALRREQAEADGQ